MPKYIAPSYLKLKRGLSGLGVFAEKNISKGRFIIEYTGEKISESVERNNKYLFRINNKYYIDGSTRKNLARYINHSCKPNCEVIIKNQKILIYAVKNIPAATELTYDYGKEYFNDFIKPHGCRCAKCKR